MDGFSLHAAVRVEARDRERLEKLCRYASRPAIAESRLRLLPDGRVGYSLTKGWKDGTTHVVLEPQVLMERLCALVPRPRRHLVTYHGVLAPAAGLRPRVVPRREVAAGDGGGDGCRHAGVAVAGETDGGSEIAGLEGIDRVAFARVEVARQLDGHGRELALQPGVDRETRVAACDEFDLHRHAVLGAWIMPAQRESTGRSCCLRETRRYVPSVSGLFLPRRTISQRGNPCEWLCCAQVRPGTGMPGSESPNLFNNRATPMRFNSVCTAVLLVAALSSPAIAQYATGFESLTASAAGTTLTGQDSFYLPVAGSVDLKAFTYAGSGMPANPDGGSVFVAGTSAGTTFARAQRDITYGTGTWRLGFDILGKYTGVLPTAQNLGSFSIQPAASQNFIALATWTDVNTAQNWNANYVWFDAAGVQLQEVVPNPAFQSLSVNHWYRWETDVNLTTNQILEVRLTDLATNTTATHVPVGRYLLGGMTPAPAPTGFRMFAGGAMGNTVAFDNVSIGTFTPPCSSLSVGGSGQPGSTLIFNLTGAAPQAPAMLLLGVLEGTTVQQIGVLGTLTLGLAHPFTPSMMGLTDATGAATLSINVPPGNLPLVTKFAQAMTVVFTPPSHGPPSLAFCTSDVESFVYGGLSTN